VLAAIAGALGFFDFLPAGCVDEVVEPEPEPWGDVEPDPFDVGVDPPLVVRAGCVEAEAAPEPGALVVVEESLDEELAVPLGAAHPASSSPTDKTTTDHFDKRRIRRDTPVFIAQRPLLRRHPDDRLVEGLRPRRPFIHRIAEREDPTV